MLCSVLGLEGFFKMRLTLKDLNVVGRPSIYGQKYYFTLAELIEEFSKECPESYQIHYKQKLEKAVQNLIERSHNAD